MDCLTGARIGTIGTRRILGLATISWLCGLALLAPPAWSDEVPAEPTPVPAAQASQPAAKAATAGVPGDIDPEGDKDHNRPEHGSLANIGAKLSDPTSNVWALQFNIQGPTFYDGDLNVGDPKLGGNVIFQPILPFPLYGTGKNQ